MTHISSSSTVSSLWPDKETSAMFGPLTFPHQNQKSNTLLKFDDDLDELSCCLLCDEKFCLTTQHEEMLLHLFNQHHLVIGDVNLIASMKRYNPLSVPSNYLAYWRIRLASNPLTDFCSTVLMDTKPDGTSSKDEKFYLLADILPEDRLLREGLQQKRLEWVLDKQAEERDDRSFSRGCLFCRQEFAGSRAEYINHLSQQHNLQLGRPENLVFTDELLDTIKHKLDSKKQRRVNMGCDLVADALATDTRAPGGLEQGQMRLMAGGFFVLTTLPRSWYYFCPLGC
uniref:ZN622/Rei1/Reh1 zinc finger C2H2-type domain-containing protein n=1 Tax=Timema poppense TaxID=170557 RepID=A0A7R9DKU5_TIMPO|nr:unnamed protein product [Timema poppensis]